MFSSAKAWSFTALILFSSSVWTVSANLFENEAITRNIEVAGSLTYVSTTYNVKPLREGKSVYTITFSQEERAVTNWIRARIKGKEEDLPTSAWIERAGAMRSTFEYAIALPYLQIGDPVSILVETVQTHAAVPWPASVSQGTRQQLKYTLDLFVLSPYLTRTQKTKIKAPTKPSNWTTPTGLDRITADAAPSVSGTSLTYGPFNNLGSSANANFQKNNQRRIDIIYDFNEPVLTITSLKRSAEISHWGSNLNIQDDIQLRNDGPTLKGQFSRLEYQMQKYQKRVTPQTVESIPLHLPPGIHSPYYYDLNGNVSTSRFRPSPPSTKVTKSRPNQYSFLEIRPRYPLVGGWNYNFTLGWDAPLADSARWDAKGGKYVAAVPMWTPMPGAVVDDAEIAIIFPEGAYDVEIFTPDYPPMTFNRTTHVTYLDTIGRPMIVVSKSQLTDKHTLPIYVSYKLSFSAHLRKPIAIAVGTFGLFAFSFIVRRVDPRIHK